ncbi:DUF4097 family beta strand repeat-containing protein [Deinococcus cavernae]|nr:DUF4097 family beta strand repeat-containing protein [Deinococcus cavernae]
MTTLPPPRPLRPVLRRMALGLALAVLGGLVAWRGATFSPTPGLETTLTPLEVPLDGPLPFDYAQAATLRFEANRANLLLNPLPPRSPLLLSGEARHRTRNPVNVSVRRAGRNVNVTTKLYVQALPNDRVLPPSPEPFQHSLRASLTPTLPLSLNTLTVGGNQTINLAGLRLRALSARSDSGRLDLALPSRPGGPYALVTRSGRVEVTAPQGATPEALRVNSQSGDLQLELGGAVVDALNAGTQSGNVALTLPRQVNRGTVTTASGDVQIDVPPATRGNLDIRTVSGDVTLRVPPGLRVRVRFTDRETLLLPPGTPAASSPQLDVFVDTASGEFNLQDD